MLGIMNNLLLEMQEGKLLDSKGVNNISRALSDNIGKIHGKTEVPKTIFNDDGKNCGVR